MTESTAPNRVVVVPFTSLTPILERVVRYLDKGAIKAGDTLAIRIGGKANNLLDLFAMGRILALCHELQRTHGVQVEFLFPDHSRLGNLAHLGFFDYCKGQGIGYREEQSRQTRFPFRLQKTDDVPHEGSELPRIPPPPQKTYWRCLAPLQRHESRGTHGERAVTAEVTSYARSFTSQVLRSLTQFGIDPADIEAELSRIISRLLKELVSNSITHSYQPVVLTAATFSRESSGGSRPGRHGVVYPSGQDKFELLVMDFGCGVLNSLSASLLAFHPQSQSRRSAPSADSINNYHSLKPWDDADGLVGVYERSLLNNIFAGEIVVRKGRKSDGLHELGRMLSWFGGSLSYRTGRTETLITSSGKGDLVSRIRPRSKQQTVYLPGVIASPVLPSHQLRTAGLRRMANEIVKRQTGVTRITPYIRRFGQLPAGFFGGTPPMQSRRRSEIDAEYMITEFSRHQPSSSEQPILWEVNLNLAENIDVGYIDSLLQELCKRQAMQGPEPINLLGFILFTNVPRDIVHALRARNCTAFLLLSKAFALFLDESEQPHFIGAPRVSNSVIDVDEMLTILFFAGQLTADSLRDLGADLVALDTIEDILSSFRGAFSLFGEEPNLELRAWDIRGALHAHRSAHLFDLDSVRIQEDDAVFQLGNGRFVDSIFDFCLFWSRADRLLDCAKLLVAEARLSPVDTIVAFMNNGDRLATAVQRIMGASQLIIADPHDPDLWESMEVDDNYILVVDALYPGDDEAGYVGKLIAYLAQREARPKAESILAFCDFRTCDGSVGDWLAGVKVTSVPIPSVCRVPLAGMPSTSTNVLRNFRGYILSKPTIEDKGQEPFVASSTLNALAYRYTPTELTSEFWQNVSVFHIIDAQRTGREARNVLFYENNERLVRHQRTRQVVTDFVAAFVKHVLHLEVDAILHPTHSVGSFLAQVAAAQLSRPPLILPVSQRNYGGALKLTVEDYAYYQQLITARMKENGHGPLRCLIVDDSVLSGSSLFTMLGAVSRLGMQPHGILVLLSRLTPETSAALRLLPVRFQYLYRLHMPLLSEAESPDKKLKKLNDRVISRASSHFAQSWARELQVESSHFLQFMGVVDEATPPAVSSRVTQEINSDPAAAHEVRQILLHLILHPDASVLSFVSRLAITYNFLEQLVREKSFWAVLNDLLNAESSPESQSVRLLQSTIFVLSHSQHVAPHAVYQSYERLCSSTVVRAFESHLWVRHPSLVADCFMGLGVMGSVMLVHLGARVMPDLLASALNSSTDAASPQNPAQQAARYILGALSWSLDLFVHEKGTEVLEAAAGVFQAILRDSNLLEVRPVLIDLLAPALARSSRLQHSLGISSWQEEEYFLSQLLEDKVADSRGELNPQTSMLAYLERAPGYTCTLKTLLRICKADTVLLFAKNSTDEQYFLRVFETVERKRVMDAVRLEQLHDGVPVFIRQRMNDDLFLVSTSKEHAVWLDTYAKRSKHRWCMGGVVRDPGSSIRYYIIFGYEFREPNLDFVSTAFFYWLRIEPLLRGILRAIHARFVESSTAWNALIQSIRPIHRIGPMTSAAEPFQTRRKILQEAMSRMDIGDKLRRAVRMSAEPVYTLQRVRDRIEDVSRNLEVLTRGVLGKSPESVSIEMSEISWSTQWPISFAGKRFPGEEKIFCAIHITLLEFIAYECLMNALSYHDGAIKMALTFSDAAPSAESGIRRLWVDLRVSNTVHELSVRGNRRNAIGLVACAAAARAVGGTFCHDEDGNSWTAAVRLPAHSLPEGLRRNLYDLLA